MITAGEYSKYAAHQQYYLHNLVLHTFTLNFIHLSIAPHPTISLLHAISIHIVYKIILDNEE